MSGDSSPVSLARRAGVRMCLLKYSSTLSMKIATGALKRAQPRHQHGCWCRCAQR